MLNEFSPSTEEMVVSSVESKKVEQMAKSAAYIFKNDRVRNHVNGILSGRFGRANVDEMVRDIDSRFEWTKEELVEHLAREAKDFFSTRLQERSRVLEAIEDPAEQAFVKQELGNYWLAQHGTNKGGQLRFQDRKITPDALLALLDDPASAMEKFGLDKLDAEEMCDWALQCIQEIQQKRKAYRQLKDAFPTNSLFRASGAVPEGKVRLFHVTGKSRLESIAEKGLLPAAGASVEKGNEEEADVTFRTEYDDVFDQKAPEGLSRTDAVFLAFEYRDPVDRMGTGGVVLEADIDPDSSYVVDAGHFELGDVDAYWGEAITVRDFLALPPESRPLFKYPEILVRGGVSADALRVAAVETVS